MNGQLTWGNTVAVDKFAHLYRLTLCLSVCRVPSQTIDTTSRRGRLSILEIVMAEPQYRSHI